jgi:predicted ATPase
MRALAADGRTNQALEVYARYTRTLRDRLGSDPTPALSAYHADLLREGEATASAAPATPAPAAPTRALRIGVRRPLNPLRGREPDLRRTRERLAEGRLVTLQGPGGIGKTRLSLEIANQTADAGGSVAVVELGGVRADDDVARAFTATLGAGEPTALTSSAPSPASPLLDDVGRIAALLDSAPTLLVVDNCEQVADGAARLLASLLAQSSTLRVLATSRAPLGIAGERIVLLDPLAARDGEGAPGPGALLFMERARAARPDAALDPEAAARLCERLDGLPLAIELAAARVRSMSVTEIEERLADRFALLVSTDRTAPDRHRTLQAVLEWSWDLLTDSQRILGRRAALLPDGFTIEAATSLSSGGIATPASTHDPRVLDDVEGLASQSLLRVEEQPIGLPTRFRMAATVREFGLQRLAGPSSRGRPPSPDDLPVR